MGGLPFNVAGTVVNNLAFLGALIVLSAWVQESHWGGGYLLVRQRKPLRPVAVTYGFCSLAVILSPGRTISAERHAYGIVSLAIALGLLLAHYPRWGRATLVFFTLVLVSFAIRFSQHLWVA